MRLAAFRRFMLAMLFFTAGMQLQAVAQGWLVFDITGSSVALGVVASMWSGTLLLFSPLGGVVADRLERRLVLILTWGGSAAVFAVVSLLILLDWIQLWHLVLASGFNGALFSFNLPARFALIPQMVGRASLVGAMALVSMLFNLNGIVFPLLAGGLIDLIGPSATYLLTALLYVASVVSVSFIPLQKVANDGVRKSVVGDLATGVRTILGHTLLRWLTLLALVAVVLGQPYTVLLPQLAAVNLDLPASGLGLLWAVIGLGGMAGNLALASLGPRANLGRLMLLLGVGSGAALIFLAETRTLYTAILALFFLGLTGGPFFTVNMTMVQRLAPPQVLGRVQSLYMLTWGAMPLGIMATSALAESKGLSLPILIDGVALVVAVVVIARVCPALLRLPRT